MDPGSYALVCRPRSDNPCKAIGSPPPRVQLLQEPLTENKYQFLCIATNTIIDNFGVHADHTDLVDFLCKHILLLYIPCLCNSYSTGNTPSCPTPPAPRYAESNHFLVWSTCHYDLTCNTHIKIMFSFICTLAHCHLAVLIYKVMTVFAVNTLAPRFMLLEVKISRC